jgi:hypothetical protein
LTNNYGYRWRHGAGLSDLVRFFFGSNIAEEPKMVFPISEGFFDERLLSVSIIEENFGQQQV